MTGPVVRLNGYSMTSGALSTLVDRLVCRHEPETRTRSRFGSLPRKRRVLAHQPGRVAGVDGDGVEHPPVGDEDVAGLAGQLDHASREAVDVHLDVEEPLVAVGLTVVAGSAPPARGATGGSRTWPPCTGGSASTRGSGRTAGASRRAAGVPPAPGSTSSHSAQSFTANRRSAVEAGVEVRVPDAVRHPPLVRVREGRPARCRTASAGAHPPSPSSSSRTLATAGPQIGSNAVLRLLVFIPTASPAVHVDRSSRSMPCRGAELVPQDVLHPGRVVGREGAPDAPRIPSRSNAARCSRVSTDTILRRTWSPGQPLSTQKRWVGQKVMTWRMTSPAFICGEGVVDVVDLDACG